VGHVVRPSHLGMAPLLRAIPGIKDLAKFSNMGNKRRSLGIMALPRALTGIKTQIKFLKRVTKRIEKNWKI